VRALIQRVKHAQVVVDGEVVGRIGPGILTLLGVGRADTAVEVEKVVGKVLRLRIFEDEQGRMNRSLVDTGGEHLIVSQFTLYGDAAKGNRPSFVDAAPPEPARALYEHALAFSGAQGVRTEGGRFQAHMEVTLLNDGPVTLMVEA
jgi:D-tyrosyl-tRNA(Tyr) deacylase